MAAGFIEWVLSTAAVSVGLIAILAKQDGKAAQPAAAGTPVGKPAAGKPAAGRSVVGKKSPADAIAKVVDALIAPKFKKPWEAVLRSERMKSRIRKSQDMFRYARDGGEVASICLVTAFFREGPAAFILATDKTIQAYIDICRKVFPTVETEVQNRLRKLLRGRQLRNKIYEDYRDLPTADPNRCAAGIPRKRYQDLGKDASAYRARQIRPLQVPTVAISEIKAALARAQVAKFDARKFIPKGLINTSVEQISAMNPRTAYSTPYNSGSFFADAAYCHRPLQELTRRFPDWGIDSEMVQIATRGLIPWMLEEKCPPVRSLGEVAKVARRFHRDPIPYSNILEHSQHAKNLASKYVRENRSIQPGAISARRLAGFKDVDFARLAGVEDVVLHSHAFVRFGPTPGLYHFDMYDNILMQVTTTVDIVIIPANCSSLAVRKIPANAGILDWATEGLPLGEWRVPFFHFKLRPGEGVIIPSGAFHNIFARDSRRVALSSFFEPKFGKMQWPWAPAHAYRRNNRDVLAARSLVIATAKRLWEEHGVGMFWHTARLELI